MAEVHRQALLPYPAEAVFDLVNDVAQYPHFLPGCVGVDVHEASAEEVLATVHAQARGISERFTTRNALDRPSTIHMVLEDGPFSSLEGAWRFTALGEAGCKVEVEVRYEASGLLGRTLAPFVSAAADRVMSAFVTRARETLPA